jgi:hypothetical protein
MNFVIAHSSLHWLEPALFTVAALPVVAAIVREHRRNRATDIKESS